MTVTNPYDTVEPPLGQTVAQIYYWGEPVQTPHGRYVCVRNIIIVVAYDRH